MCTAIRTELEPIEDQWGVRILEFGFSNISPSPTTLEITQLELLTREKRRLYGELRGKGLSEEAAVALVSGAVVSVHPDEEVPLRRELAGPEAALVEAVEAKIEEQADDAASKKAKRTQLEGLQDPDEADPFADDEEGEDQGPLGPGSV